MKILVYGAGSIGSLFAARLKDGGHEVSLLARGQRLSDLREHGLVLVDTQTGEQTVAQVDLVERLEAQDAYDLVLVILRKNRVRDILPILAENRCTPNVLFLMNNAAGPGELVEALGKERVLIGFPMAGGYRHGPVVHYLAGPPGKKAVIPYGEVDGWITERARQVGAVLASMPGFEAELHTDMDAWLKTHVALLMPSLAPAMFAAKLDNLRLARTRDLLVMVVRAIREGFQVLRALGIPVTPSKMKMYDWMPEPLLVWGFQKRLQNPLVRTALFEHAGAAKDELQHLADEFLALRNQTTVSTPNIDRLYAYFNGETPPMPDGQTEMELDWRGMWAGLAGLAGVLALSGIAINNLRKRR